MTGAEFEARAAALNAEYQAAGKALREVPGIGSGPAGLTPDAVRATPAFREASDRFNRAFRALRAFNAAHPREVAALARKQRDERRAAILDKRS